MRFFTPLLLTVLLTSACSAGEGDIKKNIEARFPGAKVDSIGKTPIAGLFEVVVDGSQVIYSDANGDYVLVGDLLDTATKSNLTKERVDKLSEVKFDTLPLDQSIRIVKGNGARRLAVFSDPDCPYCKRLDAELNKLDNVTIHVFPYPLPMHPDAARKSRLAWCSADPAKAWLDMMLQGKLPEGRDDCPNPIEANLALGQQLNIQGTPAIILTNGRRIPGMVPAAKLEGLLAEASK